MKRVTFLSIAETELAEATEYYESQQQGLGEQFVNGIENALQRIQRQPETWSYFVNPIRSVRVGPYPYRLLYRELPDRIQIIGVFHLSRHPNSWKDRLKTD